MPEKAMASPSFLLTSRCTFLRVFFVLHSSYHLASTPTLSLTDLCNHLMTLSNSVSSKLASAPSSPTFPLPYDPVPFRFHLLASVANYLTTLTLLTGKTPTTLVPSTKTMTSNHARIDTTKSSSLITTPTRPDPSHIGSTLSPNFLHPNLLNFLLRFDPLATLCSSHPLCLKQGPRYLSDRYVLDAFPVHTLRNCKR